MKKVSQIKSIPQEERPREKMWRYGPTTLTDLELMQVIIGVGTRQAGVVELSQAAWPMVVTAAAADIDPVANVRQIPGISKSAAARVLAIIEMMRRAYASSRALTDLDAVLPFVEEYRHRRQEHLVLLCLDGAARLLARRLISIGTLTRTVVHPREIFVEAIKLHAHSVILVHNHPSGPPVPSEDDISVTQVIKRAGELLGIRLLDHIIISAHAEYSFLENGQL